MEAQRWLMTALEEYKSLRTESLTSMANQQATLRYGTAALVVSLGLVINVEYASARFWALTILIPVFSLVFFAIYAIEFGRMVRVGRYIDHLEKKINSHFQDIGAPLGWEQWLDKSVEGKRPRLPFYWVLPLFFSASSGFSLLMALIMSRKDGPFCTQWNVLIIIIWGIIVFLGIFLISLKLKNFRESLDKYFGSE